MEHRARFEHVSAEARTRAPATGIFLRTVVAAELRLQPLVVGVEVLDARARTAAGTVLNTTHVNPVDILRAYAGLRLRDAWMTGDTLQVHAGRMTLDLGSRRLLARNDFRNTINSFTGVDVAWAGGGHAVRAFAVVPVLREPASAPALSNAVPVPDRENPDAWLAGAMHTWPVLPGGVAVEAYALALHERDGALAQGTDRRLLTPGLRVVRAPARGRLDVHAEVMLQGGLSRASARAEDRRDLVHAAASTHLSAGYTWDLPASPRLVVLHDFASGDASAADAVNQRFDPLFGARRFDLGPTGLWGLFSRGNINSPGVRLEWDHARRVDAFLAWRAAWLATSADAWVPVSSKRAAAADDAFVGHALETRARWHVVPGMVTLEGGGVVLAEGAAAIRARGPGWPWMGYAQVAWSL